jgi:hypothetical protein
MRGNDDSTTFCRIPTVTFARLAAVRKTQDAKERRTWSVAGAYAVLGAITKFADFENGGNARPGYASIATMCDLAPRSVIYSIPPLIAAGLLRVQEERQGFPTTYQVGLFPPATHATSCIPPMQQVAGVPMQLVAHDLEPSTEIQDREPPPTPAPTARCAPAARAAARRGGRGNYNSPATGKAKPPARTRPARRAALAPRTSAALTVTEPVAAEAGEPAPPAAPPTDKRLARWWRLAVKLGVQADAEDLARFAELWEVYPKKIKFPSSPDKALAAWYAVRELRAAALEDCDGTVGDLILFAAGEVADRYDEDPDGALSLHVWLKGERWEDHAESYRVSRVIAAGAAAPAVMDGDWTYWTGPRGDLMKRAEVLLKGEERRAVRQAIADAGSAEELDAIGAKLAAATNGEASSAPATVLPPIEPPTDENPRDDLIEAGCTARMKIRKTS